MDRFAGAISSIVEEAVDLDLVWRDGVSLSSSLVGGRSLSISESEVIAEDEVMDGDRLMGFFVLLDCVTLILLLFRFPFSVPSEESEVRMIAGFRRFRVKDRDMRCTGAKKE